MSKIQAKGQNGHFGICLNEENDKKRNSVILFKYQKTKKREKEEGTFSGWRFHFRERDRGFSLNFRQIRPSEFVGTRSKAALRIEAYVWVPVLRSFDKLREVGDLSYLGFTLYLSVL